MPEAHAKNTEQFNIDIHFFLRNIKKWFLVGLSVTVICGVLGFLLMDMRHQDSYTASALVTCGAKNNYASYQSEDNLNSAITRDVSMWNSQALRKEISKANPDTTVNGYLSASAIEGTGLVRVTAMAGTARDAYFLLNEAMRNYTKISENFDDTYRVVILTSIDQNAISYIPYSAKIYGVLGSLGGLFLSMFILSLWTFVTDILHNEDQARNLLDVPVLGALVRLQSKEKDKEPRVLLGQEDVTMDYLGEMERLISSVEQTMRREKQKVLMVTSVYSNDGKSSVASNLAIGLSKRHYKVLLMDMDLNNPSIFKVFAKEIEKKKSWFYAIQKKQALKSYAIPSADFPNLSIIYQYQPVQNSDSFIENSNVSESLNKLKESYDFIILDTPPMRVVRDTEVITHMADSFLLLIRQDVCHARVANDIIDQLYNLDTTCVGAVLNQCEDVRRSPIRKKE